MKQLVLIFSCAFSMALTAQITITSSDIAFPLTPDTAQGRVGQFLGVSLPAEGANQTWNYGNMAQSVELDFSLVLPDTNANFPAAQGMTVISSTLAGLTIEDNKSYYRYDSTGFYYLGYQLKQKTYDMSAITGSADDKVTVIGDHKNHGNAILRYKMPMTSTSAWNNIYRETVPMEFDIVGFGNPGDSVVIIQDFKEEYSVVGWGTVTMPANLGTHEALLLKHKMVRIDSVYLNGIPAPPSFISTSGLSQGDSISEQYYEIMIRGINRSAIRFNTDETYSNILSIDFCAKASVFSVQENTVIQVEIYPNPTVTGEVVLALEKPVSTAWIVKVFSLTGELMVEMPINGAGAQQVKVQLPDAPGVYVLSIEDENGFTKVTRRLARQ